MSYQKPALSLGEALAAVAHKTGPQVTRESIEAKIARVEYLQNGHLTVCFITMRNGFRVSDESGAVSAENADPAIAERFAYEGALRKLMPLEGYLLRERLAEAAALEAAP